MRKLMLTALLPFAIAACDNAAPHPGEAQSAARIPFTAPMPNMHRWTNTAPPPSGARPGWQGMPTTAPRPTATRMPAGSTKP